MAQNLMNGSAGTGYPTRTAADMLLAKVYMTLATSSTLKEDGISESDYWQMAYDEAIKVYGKHSLIPSFGDLFDSRKPENTSESIFELQISEAANNSQMGRIILHSNLRLECISDGLVLWQVYTIIMLQLILMTLE